MQPRGAVTGPFAMARPAMPIGEAASIAAAFAAMPADLSKRSKARSLARRVVAEMIASAASDDPMEIALAVAARILGNDPVHALAEHFAPQLARERVARFEARGCRQLAAAAWACETAEIAQTLESRLAERFRLAQRKWG